MLFKNDKNQIKKMVQSKSLDAILASSTDLVDDIVLEMINDGVIDCLENDKRRHNTTVPFNLIMTLAIAAKMKVHTSLTDIPYAIRDHRILAKFGVNATRNALFREGTIRHLMGKYASEDLVHYYNNTVKNRIFVLKDIQPDIHIILKNYKPNFLNYLILYGSEYFCCMSLKEFLEFRDDCDKEVQRFLLEFFD